MEGAITEIDTSARTLLAGELQAFGDSAVLVIEDLSRTADGTLFRDIRVLRKSPFPVLATKIGRDVTRLRSFIQQAQSYIFVGAVYPTQPGMVASTDCPSALIVDAYDHEGYVIADFTRRETL